MAIIRKTDEETGARYFDQSGGSYLDERKDAIENFDQLPPRVQAGWLETWEEEASTNAAAGLNGLAEIHKVEKSFKKLASLNSGAKRQHVQNLLSVSLEEALKLDHTVGTSDKKVDLIQGVRDTIGIPYSTLMEWVKDSDPEVTKEINKRADLAAADRAAKARPA